MNAYMHTNKQTQINNNGEIVWLDFRPFLGPVFRSYLTGAGLIFPNSAASTADRGYEIVRKLYELTITLTLNCFLNM